MGLSLFGPSKGSAPLPGEPVPSRFEVVRGVDVYAWCVVELRYPDAVTFGGRKIAVYDVNLDSLKRERELDPHFTDTGDGLSPIARFKPDKLGWSRAVAFAAVENRRGGGGDD